MPLSSTARYAVEAEQDWRGKIEKIPFIPIPRGWEIKVIPPFSGAYARFMVRLPDKRQKSIYLDFNNDLGYYGNPPEPYWEVHPVNGDVGRCDMDDTKQLIKLIKAK